MVAPSTTPPSSVASGYEVGEDLALDTAGSVTVTGDTRSSDFPTTPGAFDTGYNGGNCDAFVVKLNPAGSDPCLCDVSGWKLR